MSGVSYIERVNMNSQCHAMLLDFSGTSSRPSGSSIADDLANGRRSSA